MTSGVAVVSGVAASWLTQQMPRWKRHRSICLYSPRLLPLPQVEADFVLGRIARGEWTSEDGPMVTAADSEGALGVVRVPLTKPHAKAPHIHLLPGNNRDSQTPAQSNTS